MTQPAGSLRERLLTDAYEKALSRVMGDNSHLPAIRLSFERELLLLSAQPQEDRELAALTLCCAAMDRGLVWPIKAILCENSPLPLAQSDRDFLLRSHLRQAPIEPRTRSRLMVSYPMSDIAVVWSVMAEALLTPPYRCLPQDLASDYEQIATRFLSEGDSWMDPAACAPPKNSDEPSAARRCLDLFDSLRSRCEQSQLHASAGRGQVKRAPRSV